MKELMEKRNALIDEMEGLVNKAKTETRAMDEVENSRYDEIRNEIAGLDKTIKAEEEVRAMEKKEVTKTEVETREMQEERAFDNYIRGIVETRANVNMTTADNGAVIPASIANKIIKAVVDKSPIVEKATRYNIGGTLSIPFYDESTQSINVGYADEFTTAESTSAKTTSISLTGYLGRALTKVSKSLINNSKFDVVSFVINDMAEKIVIFMEKECIKGTTNKVAGLAAGVTQTITAAATNAITADEVIKLKDKVKDVFQKDAMFIMSTATRTALRLLKDTTGKYLLNDDITSAFGTTLLGKPVYVSDNMDEMVAAKTAIYYGDMSGLALKISEDINIQILREKYADEHVDGVLGFVEFDAKVENTQKIAKLVMKA